jgi:hypothetical protein
MGYIGSLKYPKKSHRKQVILPGYSVALAEFFGIMLGDGGINNVWQANITLNAAKDAPYAKFVTRLCGKLFGVLPAARTRKEKQTLVISLASISVVDFLVDKGLPRGDKLKGTLKIPSWILQKRAYRIACVRGLIDTDGCLFVHVHRVSGREYRNIGLCFTSHSLELILRVADIFGEFEIMPHISKQGNNIYLYRADDVAKYLKIFGSSNRRISSVYDKWRDARVV